MPFRPLFLLWNIFLGLPICPSASLDPASSWFRLFFSHGCFAYSPFFFAFWWILMPLIFYNLPCPPSSSCSSSAFFCILLGTISSAFILVFIASFPFFPFSYCHGPLNGPLPLGYFSGSISWPSVLAGVQYLALQERWAELLH